jgi:hypothetical protein
MHLCYHEQHDPIPEQKKESTAKGVSRRRKGRETDKTLLFAGGGYRLPNSTSARIVKEKSSSNTTVFGQNS